MNFIRHFIVATIMFFIGYVIVYGMIKLIAITLSSGTTIAIFVFGGFCSIVVWVLVVTMLDWLQLRSKKHMEMNGQARRVRDNAIEQYTSSIKNAKSVEEVDDLERRFKGALQ
jgi:hypothetical protein